MNKQRWISIFRLIVVLTLLATSLNAGAVPPSQAAAAVAPLAAEAGRFVPGELIVKFRTGVTPPSDDHGLHLAAASLEALAQRYAVSAAQPLFADAGANSFGLERVYKLSLPGDTDIWSAAEAWAADPQVEYAQPNFIYNILQDDPPPTAGPAPTEAAPSAPPVPQPAADLSAMFTQIQQTGQVHVIVGVRLADSLAAAAGPDALAVQQAAIAQAQSTVLNQLAGISVSEVRTFEYLPFIALTVDAAGLKALAASPDVESIEQAEWSAPTLTQSGQLVGAPQAWAQGFTGQGWAVAVLDTGVQSDHPFLTNKVVSEACYSIEAGQQSEVITGASGVTQTITYTVSSLCPNSSPAAPITATVAAGSARPCTLSGCDHGTHVAGIVAGYQSDHFAGVARDARLIAIQVYSRIDGQAACAKFHAASPCILSYTDSQIAALNRIAGLRAQFNIAAVNMSLGGGRYYTQADCDQANASRKLAIDNLRSFGMATVIAAGNDGYTDSLASPACISSAISVGSTNDGSWSLLNLDSLLNRTRDAVSTFSDSADFLTLFAPGTLIRSSIPNSSYGDMMGTSMAAPHVAGAWAILRQAAPLASVLQVTRAMTETGPMVTDTRAGAGNRQKPRLRVDAALNAVTGAVTIGNLSVYSFGTVPMSTTVTHVFTVTNTSEAFTAAALNPVGLTPPFAYAGGAYPGTAGTCGASLPPGASCRIVVTFNPTAYAPATEPLQIGYAGLASLPIGPGPFTATVTLQGIAGGAQIRPDDPLLSSQWGLANTGQLGGRAGADIHTLEAWGITTGTTTTLVAVVDTGVDYRHLDLKDGRIRTDLGWDFVNNRRDALDDNGHGTHVAGIIAAATNNGLGVAGIMWQARILPVKICDNKGQCTSDNIAQGIRYAADQGARVINLSLGGPECSGLVDAINYAYFDKGAVIVAAAGNDGGAVNYPARFDPVIAVGATDRNDQIARWSSRGVGLGLTAPGVSILSTVPGNGWEYLSGTSMAAPQVSGVAGLLISQRPELSNHQVRAILFSSADDLGVSGWDSTYGYGRVNAYRALQSPTPPAPLVPVRGIGMVPAAGYCAVCAAVATAADAGVEGAGLLSTVRAVRDQVFTSDPGKRWARIYYEHQFEVAWLVASDPGLRADVLSGWRAFNPVFQALLNHDPAAPPVTLTPELIEAARSVMLGVADRGSPEVNAAITTEWARVNPERFVGRDVRQVWEQLKAENSQRVFLPFAWR